MRHGVLACAFTLLTGSIPGVAARGDVFVLNLSFPGTLVTWYEAEYPRLEKTCTGDRDCWVRELERKTWILNPVHSSPTASAPRIGNVVAVSSHTAGWPHIRFDYRPHRGPQTVWLDAEDIGDWGYGIYVVVRAIGEPQQGDHPVWVRLAGVAEEAWIELQPPTGPSTSGLLEGALTPLVGSSLAVEDGIPARDLRLRRRLMLPSTANYVAERLTPNQLLVRREVGADNALCGRREREGTADSRDAPLSRRG